MLALFALAASPFAAAQHAGTGTNADFFAANPAGDMHAAGAPSSEQLPTLQRVVEADAPVVADIEIRGGRRVSGPAVVKVKQGDNVTLRITNDRVDELHLHGYNLHAPVTPGTPAVLTFTAKFSGRFTFELHKAEIEIGALEVYPK
jgi:FtsP/CotA-like multicopper oxidase with cupredoxin domain